MKDAGEVISRACEHMSFALRAMNIEQPVMIVMSSRDDLNRLKSNIGPSLLAAIMFRNERETTVKGKKVVEHMRIGDVSFAVAE